MRESDRPPSRTAYLLKFRRRFARARGILWQYPDVVGVGLGYRERSGGVTRQPSVIVHVPSKRRHVSKARRIPRTCCGLTVDVQERGKLGLCTAAVAHQGIAVRRVDGEEIGRVGLLVRNVLDAPELLTAMHVLASDVPERLYDANDAIEVETSVAGTTFSHVGRLIEGVFASRADIARIQLHGDVAVLPGLAGGERQLRAPVSPDQLAPKDDVYIALGSPLGDRAGTFHSLDYEATFDLDTGASVRFSGLLAFKLQAQAGWSGSVIFDTWLRPIALLSFADTERRSGLCFGWPLHDYCVARKLKPL